MQTGIATAVIVRTGKDAAFGKIAQWLASRPPETGIPRAWIVTQLRGKTAFQ